MDKKEMLFTTIWTTILFTMSFGLAWLWFGWKMAVVITLALMSASGRASLN